MKSRFKEPVSIMTSSDSDTERPKGIYTSRLVERKYNKIRKRDKSNKSEQRVHGDHANAPDLHLVPVSVHDHLKQGIQPNRDQNPTLPNNPEPPTQPTKLCLEGHLSY